jgi:hypothetical protein
LSRGDDRNRAAALRSAQRRAADATLRPPPPPPRLSPSPSLTSAPALPADGFVREALPGVKKAGSAAAAKKAVQGGAPPTQLAAKVPAASPAALAAQGHK